jgi:hypothetical protein
MSLLLSVPLLKKENSFEVAISVLSFSIYHPTNQIDPEYIEEKL